MTMKSRLPTNARRSHVQPTHRHTTMQTTSLAHRLPSWNPQPDRVLQATEATSHSQRPCRVVNLSRSRPRTITTSSSNSRPTNSNISSSTAVQRLRPRKVVLCLDLHTAHRPASNTRNHHMYSKHSLHHRLQHISRCSNHLYNISLTPTRQLLPPHNRVLTTATNQHLHTRPNTQLALPRRTDMLTGLVMIGLLHQCQRNISDLLFTTHRLPQCMLCLLASRHRPHTAPTRTNNRLSHRNHIRPNLHNSHITMHRLRYRAHAHLLPSLYNRLTERLLLHLFPREQRHISIFLLYLKLSSPLLLLFPHLQAPTATSPTLMLVKSLQQSHTSALMARPSLPRITMSPKRRVRDRTQCHSPMAHYLPISTWTMTTRTKVC
jgi:hypothetical protein